MKETALTKKHIELGAKMADFAGYTMPIQYKGIKHEHATVREKVGVFDVSHMGEFFVKGRRAVEFLQKITSNDVSRLEQGEAQYCYMPNDKGGIVDDLIIYNINHWKYMLVVNASNIEKDWEWINSHNDEGVTITNQSGEWSLLAIQGPKAAEAIQPLTPVKLDELKFYNFEINKFAGAKDVIISATGYTGSGGFEIYVKNKDVEHVWNEVFNVGEPYGIEPIGLGARDTLRLEMGFCLYGNDIDETTSPFEAGLGWITKFNKEFINSDALKKEKEAGIKNKLVGFELIEKGIPRAGHTIVNKNGETIGKVTSGTMSPSLNKPIGLGYVPKSFANGENELFIQIRNKTIPANVVKTPFYKK